MALQIGGLRRKWVSIYLLRRFMPRTQTRNFVALFTIRLTFLSSGCSALLEGFKKPIRTPAISCIESKVWQESMAKFNHLLGSLKFWEQFEEGRTNRYWHCWHYSVSHFHWSVRILYQRISDTTKYFKKNLNNSETDLKHVSIIVYCMMPWLHDTNCFRKFSLPIEEAWKLLQCRQVKGLRCTYTGQLK